MKETLLSMIHTDCPFRGSLHWYEAIDSTNTQAKRLAKDGAPHGTVLAAGSQSAGRGRMGRQFQSPAGTGVYLSVILRPGCAAAELMHLTCAAAVAACDAVEQVSGSRPGIKWINDLVAGRKKLGGILTELSIDPKTGLAEYAIIGIGINCTAVPQQVSDMAACVGVSPTRVCAALVENLAQMDSRLLTGKEAILSQYRKDCVTLGQTVKLMGTGQIGTALDVTDDGGLVITLPDGTQTTVSSGEVSVRGMYGYV